MIEYLPLVLTGIGIIASILYYASVLRNANKTQQMQLETRQAQLFMNIYNQSYTDPQFQQSRAVLMTKKWDTFEDFRKIYHLGENADPEFIAAYDYLGSFYEGVGVFVREGFLDIRFVALLMTGNVRNFWERTQPIKDEMRTEYNWPRLLIETEYLHNELMKYHKEHPELELKN
jgi:hypothetical protein